MNEENHEEDHTEQVDSSPNKAIIIVSVILFILVLIAGGYLLNTIYQIQRQNAIDRLVASNGAPVETEILEIYMVTQEIQGALLPEISTLQTLYVYPNYTPLSSKEYTEEGGIGYDIVLETEDDMSTVVNWYLAKIDKTDWEIVTAPKDLTGKTSVLISAIRGDVNLSVTVQNVKGLTKILITHQQNMGEYKPATYYEYPR